MLLMSEGEMTDAKTCEYLELNGKGLARTKRGWKLYYTIADSIVRYRDRRKLSLERNVACRIIKNVMKKCGEEP
jgi:hypothetical protein